MNERLAGEIGVVGDTGWLADECEYECFKWLGAGRVCACAVWV